MAVLTTCETPGSERATPPRKDAPSLIAWSPKAELEHPEWVLMGRRLSAIARSSQWWIGDWLLYGAMKWGEKYVEASRITGYDVGSLRNMASLASQFDPSRRRDDLTWCHHAAVASLDCGEQDHWLERASALRLSVADLRIELRAARREHTVLADSDTELPAASAERAPVICPNCGYALAFTEPDS
jgi:hypothetical protein